MCHDQWTASNQLLMFLVEEMTLFVCNKLIFISANQEFLGSGLNRVGYLVTQLVSLWIGCLDLYSGQTCLRFSSTCVASYRMACNTAVNNMRKVSKMEVVCVYI